MLGLALFSLLFFLIGALSGRLLASKGITINFKIEEPKYQKLILIILVIFTLIILSLVLIDNLNLSQRITLLIPDIIVLYLGEYLYDFMIVIGTYVLGLLCFLELFSQSTPQSKTQLLSSLLIISLILSLLVHKTWPIIGELGKPKIIDNYVVLQTTDYTCAPASIATLGRFLGKYTELSEKDVVLLTNTDRRGTSILVEIKTLKKLNLNPEYRRGLTLDELSKINKPALLHVRQKIGGQIIPHAIALLSINDREKVFKIANPLSGIHNKSYEEMKEYWYGEAVFINYPK